MRSRYSAFCTVNVQYLIDTALPKQQPYIDRAGLLSWAKESEWLGLSVHSSEQESDDVGYVHFTATYSFKGKQEAHEERSCFRLIDGFWYYDDGKPIPVSTFKRDNPKVGRNDPCPCGSGKKFKKCCGA